MDYKRILIDLLAGFSFFIMGREKEIDKSHRKAYNVSTYGIILCFLCDAIVTIFGDHISQVVENIIDGAFVIVFVGMIGLRLYLQRKSEDTEKTYNWRSKEGFGRVIVILAVLFICIYLLGSMSLFYN